MAAIQRKERNQAINKAFTEKYNEARTTYGRASFQAIYFVLSQKFSLSEMQIRRIVKGY